MQERDRGAVLRALPPIALGHEASVALAAALVIGVGLLADTTALHMGRRHRLVIGAGSAGEAEAQEHTLAAVEEHTARRCCCTSPRWSPSWAWSRCSSTTAGA